VKVRELVPLRPMRLRIPVAVMRYVAPGSSTEGGANFSSTAVSGAGRDGFGAGGASGDVDRGLG
jgi:hypothetical protein